MESWERVQYIMEKEGLNKNSFSSAIGISNNVTITRIINEHRTPSRSTCQKIVNAFPKYRLDWLMTGDGPIIKPLQENHDVNQIGSTYIGSTFVGYGDATNNKTYISGNNSNPNKESDQFVEKLIKEVESLKAENNMLKGENRVLREQLGLGERKESSKTA